MSGLLEKKSPWRVETLAADFEEIDRWSFDLDGGRGGFEHFLEVFWFAMRQARHWTLFRLREAIGRFLGWDDRPGSLAIPGCMETSVASRLRAVDHEHNNPAGAGPNPMDGMRFIYRFKKEALYEISNGTVHALLHLSLPEQRRVEMRVYIKSRGHLTRLYMGLIRPFRHLYVYPKLIALVEKSWRAAG